MATALKDEKSTWYIAFWDFRFFSVFEENQKTENLEKPKKYFSVETLHTTELLWLDV